MAWLPCPYLGREVELTAERERHIRRKHPGVLPDRRQDFVRTLADPDLIIVRAWSPSQTMLVRELPEGEWHIVAVVNEDEPVDDLSAGRAWVLTSYLATDLPSGLVTWQREA